MDPAEKALELPLLSPAEWQTFALLSKKGPLTVRQLVTELSTADGPVRSYATVLTPAQRLSSKGYLYQMLKAAEHGPARRSPSGPPLPMLRPSAATPNGSWLSTPLAISAIFINCASCSTNTGRPIERRLHTKRILHLQKTPDVHSERGVAANSN